MKKIKIKKSLVFLFPVLIILISIYVFEKNYHRNINKEAVKTNIHNLTSNTATTPTTNTEKEASNFTPSTNTSKTSINIILNAAGQDNPSGPLIIRSQITGLVGGNCTIELTNNIVKKVYNLQVTLVGNTYTCNTTIPYSELYPGEWLLKFTTSNDTNSSTLNRTIQII